MCSHNWRKFGEVWACMNCGLTKTSDGRLFFDKELPNYKPKKKNKKRGKK